MFKLFVLAALLAVAAARPGHLAAAPLVYAAPAATVVHEPALAKVGAVVKSVPTAVSHQSITQVHSTPVLEDVVAPVVKTTLHQAALPAVATYAAAAPAHYAALPAYSTYAAHGLTPVAYNAPIGYSSPLLHHAPLTYASAW
ncbi:larval/pupal cuticle protein H1C [Drosophila busckii]|uniref:larval/pupal cuticle protein H1C n=1 Tax=Drosophila busckii TaxID=30019 RepID=UPI001432A68B|nr:larval/pupal cuticle protein H1C [Drosophila busckii]